MLPIEEVTRVAEEAAGATSPDFKISGVLLGGSSDSAYVEILITITGCRNDVCQVSVGVFRDIPADELRDQIEIKLRDHLETH